MSERVVVTGMGAISPVGLDVEATWQNLISGRSGVAHVTSFDASGLKVTFGAEVKGFDPTLYMSAKEARRTDRFVQFAVAAAKQAVAQASLTVDEEDADEVGVIFGSGIGGVGTYCQEVPTMMTKGPHYVNPFLVPMIIINMASAQIAIHLGAQGPSLGVVSACSTGADAIGQAYETIRRGDAEVMVAGGSEAALLPIGLAAFDRLKALSHRNDEPEKASRPFDAQRDGFVLGEGGAALVLESLSHAKSRGAIPLAELVGYGTSTDAIHITAPVVDGRVAARAITRALEKGGIAPEEVDYICAHATSTPVGDRHETLAIKHAFGKRAYEIPISSIKSMIGHTLGAAGALEAIVCVMAIREGIVPPTINYEYPDPDCDLDYVPNQARRVPVRVAISNSFGFGGHNVCLVFRAMDD